MIHVHPALGGNLDLLEKLKRDYGLVEVLCRKKHLLINTKRTAPSLATAPSHQNFDGYPGGDAA